MTTTKQDRPEIERLKALLEVHGGNRERWPSAARDEIEQLVVCDPQAAGIVAEARALDRLLDEAPALAADRLSHLADAIVAAAQAEGRWQGADLASESSHITSLPIKGAPTSRRRTDEQVSGLAAHARNATGWRPFGMLSGARRGPVASAAMLCASLMIGVVIGLSFTSVDVATDSQVVADAGDDVALRQLVIGEETLDKMVEDLL